MSCLSGIGDVMLPPKRDDPWSTHYQIADKHSRCRPRSSFIRSRIEGDGDLECQASRHSVSKIQQRNRTSEASISGPVCPEVSQPSNSTKTAYFSVQPPWMPMELIPYTSSTELTSQNFSPPPIVSFPHLTSKPSKPGHLNFSSRSPSPSGCITLTPNPINPSNLHSSMEKVKNNIVNDHNNLKIETVARSQIAVQAQELPESGAEDVDNSGKSLERNQWMGGVRALRDSYVRIVLRQLRHVERLNHAIDRVAQLC